MKTFKIINNDISDGYHTFDELYDHRSLLYINLCLLNKEKCVIKIDEHFGEWFCLYYESEVGQISYHLHSKFLNLIGDKIRRDDNHKWDEHTSEDVLARLRVMITQNKMNTQNLCDVTQEAIK